MMLTPQVKSSLLTAIFTSVILSIFYLIFSQTPYFPRSDSSKAQPFTVQGTATVKAKPDQATISFTVTKTETALQNAQNEANTVTNTIISDLEKSGINKNALTTSNYNSNPNYATPGQGGANSFAIPVQPNNSQTIVSYTVSEDVSIAITDNAKVNSVIDLVTKDGAENISGPNFTFSDATQQKLQDQARNEAIANAKQKAQSIASAAGIRLGKITNIQEGDMNNGYPIIRPMLMNAKADSGTVTVSTNIQPGENTVVSNVTLSYDTY